MANLMFNDEPGPDVERPMLSAAAVAALLGISRSTLRRWVTSGVMFPPDLRVGRVRRWHHRNAEFFVKYLMTPRRRRRRKAGRKR
ncbi:MAG: helix-turn-helix domain-containing protein [Planctomycetes bacterium]|nr:helix-turn-helix domain-containing protein [Planctomycetota bacterium]